jgi:MOSC domain-containing protein YiiM
MKVTSVNVGRSRRIAIGAGTVASAIGKQAVAGTVALRPLGLAGDEQADLSVHGGLAKAVYAYPSEHYAFWRTVRAQAGVAPCDAALPPGRLMSQSAWCGFYLAVREAGTIEAGQAFAVEAGPRDVSIDSLFRARVPAARAST